MYSTVVRSTTWNPVPDPSQCNDWRPPPEARKVSEVTLFWWGREKPRSLRATSQRSCGAEAGSEISYDMIEKKKKIPQSLIAKSDSKER